VQQKPKPRQYGMKIKEVEADVSTLWQHHMVFLDQVKFAPREYFGTWYRNG
jgi:hypothetical protein